MANEIQQLCANEGCDRTVPVQVGPRLCILCQRERTRTDAHLDQAIVAMSAGIETARHAAIGLENIALVEQVGRLARERDTLERMVRQHRTDRTP